MSQFSKVLSGSQLGSRCLKKLWYLANEVKGEPISEELRRVFDIGLMMEELVVKWQREKGRDVYHNAKVHTDEPDFELLLSGGKIVGRFDAIFDRHILVDIKSCGDWAFGNLQDGKIPYEWVVQINVYFFGLKLGSKREDIRDLVQALDKVGIVGVHKVSGKMVEIVRDPLVDIFESALRRAEKVFSASSVDELPGYEDECSWCEYYSICKGAK